MNKLPLDAVYSLYIHRKCILQLHSIPVFHCIVQNIVLTNTHTIAFYNTYFKTIYAVYNNAHELILKPLYFNPNTNKLR